MTWKLALYQDENKKWLKIFFHMSETWQNGVPDGVKYRILKQLQVALRVKWQFHRGVHWVFSTISPSQPKEKSWVAGIEERKGSWTRYSRFGNWTQSSAALKMDVLVLVGLGSSHAPLQCVFTAILYFCKDPVQITAPQIHTHQL